MDRWGKGVPWLPMRFRKGGGVGTITSASSFSEEINLQFSTFPVLPFPKCSSIKTRKQTLPMAFILTDTRGTVTESLCLTFTTVGSCCYPGHQGLVKSLEGLEK